MNALPEKSFRIETMTMEHLDQVLAIERSVFSDPWSEMAFLAEVEAGGAAFSRVALGYPDGSVVGYFVAWFVGDEVHLGNLAVETSHQGKGLGQFLIDYLLSETKNRKCRKITLEVRESNLVAQRLYLKNGFQPVALRRKYYPDNREDAIVMLLEV